MKICQDLFSPCSTHDIILFTRPLDVGVWERVDQDQGFLDIHKGIRSQPGRKVYCPYRLDENAVSS